MAAMRELLRGATEPARGERASLEAFAHGGADGRGGIAPMGGAAPYTPMAPGNSMRLQLQSQVVLQELERSSAAARPS